MRGPYLFLLSLAAAGVLRAAPDYSQLSATGLAIYKPHDFAADKTAHLLEYRNFVQHPAVTVVTTQRGARLTIPTRSAEIILIPYPGRGDATPGEALAVLEVATPRFPQFRKYLRPLKAAWTAEMRRPETAIVAEVNARAQRRSVGESFLEWVRQVWPKTPPPKLPPNPFDPMTTERPVQPVAPEESDQAGTTSKEENPLDLERNLEIIQRYYQTIPEAQ